MIELRAEEIRDSRGDPTVRVTFRFKDVEAQACVPSGKSAGVREAKELRDEDGRGVSKAIANIEGPIQDAIRELPLDPTAIDRAMLALDPSPKKSRIGANAMIGVSIASRRASALSRGIPLWKLIAEETESVPEWPRLYVNVLNGGVHANFALPFQEYLLVVSGNPDVAYEKTIGSFARLGDIVRREFGEVPMGDEGGYAPTIKGVARPFELLEEATEGDPSIGFAIDAAASEFFHDGKYILSGVPHSGDELMRLYESLLDRFHLKSIEDPFQEFDQLNFQIATTLFDGRALVVGDDFTVTNPTIVRQAVAERCANAMIVKPNQVGTLLETFDAVHEARRGGWKLIVSHRSGETMDDFIADLAVGLGAYGMKAGAPSQPERRAKYDRLIAIASER